MNYDLDMLKAITEEAGDFTPAVEVVDAVMYLLYETPPGLRDVEEALQDREERLRDPAGLVGGWLNMSVIEIKSGEDWVALYSAETQEQAIEWGTRLAQIALPKPQLRLVDSPGGTVIGSWRDGNFEEGVNGY